MARVLVVEDADDIRELLMFVLAAEGHEVESVSDGRAATARLAKHPYELVVCDLHMPEEDGPAVYRAVQATPSPHPAVLFVTGYANAPGYEGFIRTTNVPVLAKPFEINALRGQVRRLLGAG
jgi:CheY-like chemotaxis protein